MCVRLRNRHESYMDEPERSLVSNGRMGIFFHNIFVDFAMCMRPGRDSPFPLSSWLNIGPGLYWVASGWCSQ